MINMIYLDYAATTPIDKKVVKAMLPYLTQKYGNPSSIHSFGRDAKNALLQSREIWSDFFGVVRDNIIFCGSASEANNLVIRGFFSYLKKKNKLTDLRQFHAITSAIEHKSVLNTFKNLETNEGLAVSYIKPDNKGIVNVEDVKKVIKENTVFISIMYVNNEIGSIQPILKISQFIQDLKLKTNNLKKKDTQFNATNIQYPLIHSDCVQAIQFYDCNLQNLGIDFATASAHKIYGPKGVGILAAKNTTFLEPLITGGPQENNLRAGTENVASIVGSACALENLIKERSLLFKKITILKKKLLNGIIKNYPQGLINGDINGAPHILNYCFCGVEGESLLIYLDLEGVAVSLGSACEAGRIYPSYVLKAIGLSDQDAQSSIRFSLGKYTTENEIKKTLLILKTVLKKIKKFV